MNGENPAVRAAVAIGLTVLGIAALILLLGDAAYMWIKAVHVVAIISWMAGMLYLPRLFVYHCDAKPGSELSETLKVMERRLLRVIINPAMGLAWVLGLWLAWRGGYLMAGWFHAKLALVILLSGFHGYLSAALRRFAEDANQVPARRWRLLNEVPALLMIGIVVLVIVKPF
jgi:putative membrane protein